VSQQRANAAGCCVGGSASVTPKVETREPSPRVSRVRRARASLLLVNVFRFPVVPAFQTGQRSEWSTTPPSRRDTLQHCDREGCRRSNRFVATAQLLAQAHATQRLETYSWRPRSNPEVVPTRGWRKPKVLASRIAGAHRTKLLAVADPLADPTGTLPGVVSPGMRRRRCRGTHPISVVALDSPRSIVSWPGRPDGHGP